MGAIDKPEADAEGGYASSLGTKRLASVNKKASSSREELQTQFLAQREALRNEINENGIARAPVGSRELPYRPEEGGGYYGWQFYLRGSLLKGEHLDFVARCFWAVNLQRFAEAPFQIAGVEAAAAPILTALVMRAYYMNFAVNAFTIRKERKKYGLGNLIEGQPNNLPVMLIDDLTSVSHDTLWHAIRAVKGAGLVFYPRCFVVVFKGRRDTAPRVLKTSLGEVMIESIYTLEDFKLG